MKFTYQYRTSQNEARSGVIKAVDRDSVYSVLKARGIRPSRVDEVPGVMNKLLGRGKRWMAIVMLVLALVGTLAIGWRMSRRTAQARMSPLPRHQIYGEPALMAHLVRTGYTEVFSVEAERYLAHFVQPGRMPNFEHADWRNRLARSIPAALTNQVSLTEGEPREIEELKRSVEWLKDEIRRYLSNGVGTPESYVTRLLARQSQEVLIYDRIERELRGNSDSEELEKRNALLRTLGLPTFLPEDIAEQNMRRHKVAR